MRHLNIIVKGKVQGVSFRASTKAVADLLGVRGSVRNLDDGSVAVEAEGNDAVLEMFLEYCREGHEHAIVEDMEVTEGEIKNYRNFEVLKR